QLYALWKNASIYNPDSSVGGVLGGGVGIGLEHQAEQNAQNQPAVNEEGNVEAPPPPPPQAQPEGAPTGVSNDSADSPGAEELGAPSLLEYFKTEMEEGSAFISFRVDDTGPVSESFSNSYRASELAEKINSTAASARSTYFNLAGGNLGDNAVMNVMESIVG
ncbi:hypothetical protein, partial [Neisseria sp. P0024.S002]|uniref:hypothetical protein n=1 Tax=Neisseria sp. P0024.S002 TaxID=3436846 RepID=UPI003F802F72